MKSIKGVAKLYCGVDVSGNTLDVCYQTTDGVFEWCKCDNSTEGFIQI